MKTHFSYCEYHLGDNLAHLQFLRAMAQTYPQHSFVHFVHGCYMKQLSDVVCDIPTITLGEIAKSGHTSGLRNVWKNAGGFWENHRYRNDYSLFYIEWFRHLAAEMGLESPIFSPTGLVFDYPKLLEPAWPGMEFDYLIINSRPQSGQFMAYDHVDYFDPLIEELTRAGKRVACTQTSVAAVLAGAKVTTRSYADYPVVDSPLTITQIGNLSLRCKNIIAVATGPMWPCHNIWRVLHPSNEMGKFVVCIDCPERNIIQGNGVHYARNMREIREAIGL